MDDLNRNLPPDLDTALNGYYTAPQPDPAFARRMETQLRMKHAMLTTPLEISPFITYEQRKSYMRTQRLRGFAAILLALVGLLILTGVVYAAGRLFGFIPGVGFVDHVQSVLATPVEVNRPVVESKTTPFTSAQTSSTPRMASGTIYEGTETSPGRLDAAPMASQERGKITLTVDQVVSEPDRLVITYKITGLPADIFSPDRSATLSAAANQKAEDPYIVNIRLADGSVLPLAAGGECSGGSDTVTSWMSCRLIRGPLPKDVNRFTLEFKYLPNTLPGELPEDWSVPIELSPVSSSDQADVNQKLDLKSPKVNGMTLHLIKAVQTPSESAFQLALSWDGANRLIHHTAPITLQDAGGRYYILSGAPDGGASGIDQPNYGTLPSVMTTPVDAGSPLTFRLNWVMMSISSAAYDDPAGAPILRVDAGKSAHVGQEWSIDQTIQAGGYNLHFTKARLKPAEGGTIILEIDADPQPGIASLNLLPAEGSASYEAGFDNARNVLVSRITLPTLPTKPVDLYISEILCKINGPWEVTWQPTDQGIAALSPTPAPTRMAPANSALATGQPLLDEMQKLRQSEAVPAGPGWVHQVFQIDQADSAKTLDTGDLPEQPLEYRTDTWYRLDEQGYIREAVYIRSSPDGKLLGVDIDNGIYHFSLPEGSGGMGTDVYIAKPSYDFNQVAYFNDVVTGGGTISREDSQVDGSACRLYTATQTFNPAAVYSNEALPARASRHSVCIDPKTGTVLQIQDRMEYTDGTSQIRDTTRFLSLEKVDSLPADVQQYLDQVVMP
jgi:hypothetical protein